MVSEVFYDGRGSEKKMMMGSWWWEDDDEINKRMFESDFIESCVWILVDKGDKRKIYIVSLWWCIMFKFY